MPSSPIDLFASPAMTEVHALRKHPCPQCGGDAEWNPAKNALACPFCGSIVAHADNAVATLVAEHDLAAAMAAMDGSAADASRRQRAVRCESCRAVTVFAGDRSAQRCDFCGSPAIVPADDPGDAITPESLLPVKIPETHVRDQLRQWYRTRWFAPNKLKRAALTDTLRGIYLPYWTFDAHAEADWTAESGYHYYVTESYRDSDGRTRTRQVRHTRWEPSAGSVAHFFDDDVVPGTVGVHTSLLRKVEPFPTRSDLQPYDPVYIRGWTVERYQVDLKLAAQTSRQQMETALRQICAREVPGDTHRNLQVDATYHDCTFKHILVPVWLATYTYGAKSFQVVVNGYTGKMAGEHPLSWVKILLAVLAVILLVLVVAALANR